MNVKSCAIGIFLGIALSYLAILRCAPPSGRIFFVEKFINGQAHWQTGRWTDSQGFTEFVGDMPGATEYHIMREKRWFPPWPVMVIIASPTRQVWQTKMEESK